MTASDALRQIWTATSAEAAQQPGYYHRRVPFSGPATYAGIVRPGTLRRLSIEVDKSAIAHAGFEDQTRGYLISVEDRDGEQKGRVFINLQEVPPSPARDLFVIFTADVLDHVSKCVTEPDAVRVLRERLQHWKRFFQSRIEGLTREEYIGLYAELDFFRDGITAGVVADALANAWQGPIGANQDFLFGSVAVEIKACTGNETSLVPISNVRQLDDTGIGQLYLCQKVYDFREGTGETLAMIVGSLRRREAFVAALRRRGIETISRSGIYVWIPVREEGAVIQGLLNAGWAVRPGERFRIKAAPAIRVMTSRLPVQDAERLASDIARYTASRVPISSR